MSLLGFDETLHRQHLIKNIRNQSVALPRGYKFELKELTEWCNTHIGEKRPYHPIYEAEQGWLDYFDGEWAYTFYTDEEVHLIWIMRKEKRTEFAMRWL